MPKSILNNLELAAINAAASGTHSQTMRAVELKEMQKMGWITEETVTSFVEVSSPISSNNLNFSLAFDERLKVAIDTVQIFIELFLTEVELEEEYCTELKRLRNDFAAPPTLKPMESVLSPNNDTEALKHLIQELEEQEATIRHRITTTPDLTERRGLAKELVGVKEELVLAEKDVFLALRRFKIQMVELRIDGWQRRLTLAIELLESSKFLDELITRSIERSIELSDSLGKLKLVVLQTECAGRKARHKRELEEAASQQ